MNTTQPDDRAHFILPDLGEGIHEAELIRWIVQPGDAVDELQPMAEMETDKALVEVPSPWAGVIKELHGKEGDIITVGSILVSYEPGGSTPAPLPSSPGQKTADMEPTAGEPAAETEAEEEDAGTVVGTMDEAMTVPASLSDRREPPAASRCGGARGGQEDVRRPPRTAAPAPTECGGARRRQHDRHARFEHVSRDGGGPTTAVCGVI